MKGKKVEKVSITLILILIALMISFVFVQIKVFSLGKEKKYFKVSNSTDWGKIEDIKAAKEMYLILKGNKNFINFIDNSAKKRTLKYFYSLRAYNGAPPVIPHPVEKHKSLTGDSCLGCHREGGFVPKYNAYAPIVPHPDKVSCRQCHNPINEKKIFKKIVWRKNIAKRGIAHLPNSPLTIPHSIQMRENCLACHSGPAAVSEIRTTHPERINCMQCHVEQKVSEIWVRK